MDFFLKKDYGFDFDEIGKLANNIVDASWMAILGYKYITNSVDTPQRSKILQTLRNKEK